MKSLRLFFIAILLPISQILQSQISVPDYFTDHMVLQQHKEIPFFGTARPNSNLSVQCSWNKKQQSVAVDEYGKWSTTIQTANYGGPFTIKISQGNKDSVLIEDILIGEVWFCSGQSNMEMPLAGWGKIANYEQEIKAANFPKIRLLNVQHTQSNIPKEKVTLKAPWQVCSPSTVADFSATAYFFARKVFQETGIPVGLIHSSWGGTVIEAWTSGTALKKVGDFDKGIAALTSDPKREALHKFQEESLHKWRELLTKKNQEISTGWEAEQFDDNKWGTMNLPGFWEDDQEAMKDFDGMVYFRKSFNLTQKEGASEISVSYLADDNDKLWINGYFIGATQGYNVPSNFTIPDTLVHAGRNQIVIQVFDGGNQGGVYGDSEDFFIQTVEKKTKLTGLWKFKKTINLKDLPSRPSFPTGQYRPSVLFNAMVHPFLRFPLAGVLWYQGESNVDRAHQYRKLFPLLITDWRQQFHQKNLPFYYVQLANFQQPQKEPVPSAWAELRNAQLQALQLSNTGMAVTIDIGDANDIHPKNKQEVGRRLALIALKNLYEKEVIASGPLLKDFQKHDTYFLLQFNHTAKGLKFQGTKLLGFQLSDKEGHFVFAEAELIGPNKVKVFSRKIDHPSAVRYNWEANPNGNLTNSVGLPASPFKTDQFKDTTAHQEK